MYTECQQPLRGPKILRIKYNHWKVASIIISVNVSNKLLIVKKISYKNLHMQMLQINYITSYYLIESNRIFGIVVPSPLPAKRRCKAVKQNNFIVDNDYESEPEDPFESDGTSDEYLPEESDTD